MGSSFVPSSFNIFEIYQRFCDITSGMANDGSCPRQALAQLLTMVESCPPGSYSISEEIYKLMMRLDLRRSSPGQYRKADFLEFPRFYEFVFFICRENGQKNITVSRAVMAWRLVLAGRFYLLNQWCNFVETTQRHNINEDTWKLVLAFSRSVRYNLEGYDPEGAWPVLIDEFIDHMYRIRSNARNLSGSCNDLDAQPADLPGLKTLPGSKRKFCDNLQKEFDTSEEYFNWNAIRISKRGRINNASMCINCEENSGSCAGADESMETLKHNSPLGSSKSPCAVEGYLSKGFAGLLSDRVS